MDTMLRLGEETKRVQGERIRRARMWVALTQKELAAEISWLTDTPISHNIISQIEKGDRDVTTREMRAIEYVTGQHRDWLEDQGGEFDDSVTTATLNRVIPGYENRLWHQLINPWQSRLSLEFDRAS
jgi:ribosome-binding protein aMBF1 (putative translation factor)